MTVILHVRPIPDNSSVQKVFGNLLPHSVPVYKVVDSFTNLREATERSVIQIRQDLIENVLWQLGKQHGERSDSTAVRSSSCTLCRGLGGVLARTQTL